MLDVRQNMERVGGFIYRLPNNGSFLICFIFLFLFVCLNNEGVFAKSFLAVTQKNSEDNFHFCMTSIVKSQARCCMEESEIAREKLEKAMVEKTIKAEITKNFYQPFIHSVMRSFFVAKNLK